MNRYLAHLAERLGDAPDFLAGALSAYVRSERLDEAALAARLRCPVETLPHLRLCLMPRELAPLFWQDVEQIAARFTVDAEVLAEVVRRGQCLLKLRGVQGERPEPGYLLAARDEARKDEPPEGAPP